LSLKTYLKDASSYRVSGMLRISGPDEPFLGPGRIELLQRIAATGSINKAAKEMGMSYKKAWMMVQSLNRQVKTPLILTQTGGEQGGGAHLSAAAEELIQAYQALQECFEAFLQEETLRLLREE
jgi:molybdate transport system regulatory protein